MAQCSNCHAKLSCGCQKRVAKDGKQVCSNCIAAYEASLKPSAKTQRGGRGYTATAVFTKTEDGMAPQITSVKYNPPSIT